MRSEAACHGREAGRTQPLTRKPLLHPLSSFVVTLSRTRGLALLVVLAASALSRTADADTVYLTKDEALSTVLGTDCEIRYEKRAIPSDLLHQLEEIDASPEGDPVSHTFTCFRNGRPAGYAFIDQQIGKHAPITFIVGIDLSGRVTRTEIMVYRENYGSQARERSFMQQFEQKDLGSSLRVGRDIKHVTGATLSSKAIATGVRRNLAIWKYFFDPRSDA